MVTMQHARLSVSSRGITPRETEVLAGILDGKTYAQIAFDLTVTHDTIKTYVNRLRKKLGIRTKVGLALYARDNLIQVKPGTAKGR